MHVALPQPEVPRCGAATASSLALPLSAHRSAIAASTLRVAHGSAGLSRGAMDPTLARAVARIPARGIRRIAGRAFSARSADRRQKPSRQCPSPQNLPLNSRRRTCSPNAAWRRARSTHELAGAARRPRQRTLRDRPGRRRQRARADRGGEADVVIVSGGSTGLNEWWCARRSNSRLRGRGRRKFRPGPAHLFWFLPSTSQEIAVPPPAVLRCFGDARRVAEHVALERRSDVPHPQPQQPARAARSDRSGRAPAEPGDSRRWR